MAPETPVTNKQKAAHRRLVQRLVAGRHDQVWGSMLYRCDDGHEERVYLGVGVEGPGELRAESAYIASPFMIGCRYCESTSSHVEWEKDEEFAPRDPPPGVRYFKIPQEWRSYHRRHYMTSGFSGDFVTATEPREGGEG